MKLICVFVILICLQSYSQDFIFVNTSVSPTIYRGIKNDIFIQTNVNSYSVECKNCDSIYRSKSNNNSYIIIPGKGKNVWLKVVNDNTDEKGHEEFVFPVLYLPDPILYIGSSRNGSKISQTSDSISVLSEIGSKDATFEIMKWELSYGNIRVDGSGSKFSKDAKKVLEEIADGEVFAVRIWLKDPTGTIRCIGGVFSV